MYTRGVCAKIFTFSIWNSLARETAASTGHMFLDAGIRSEHMFDGQLMSACWQTNCSKSLGCLECRSGGVDLWALHTMQGMDYVWSATSSRTGFIRVNQMHEHRWRVTDRQQMREKNAKNTTKIFANRLELLAKTHKIGQNHSKANKCRGTQNEEKTCTKHGIQNEADQQQKQTIN